MVKKIMSIAAIVLLGLVALVGGLMAAVGFDSAMSLFGGGDSEMVAEEVAPPQPPAEPGKTIVVTPFKEIIVNITATTATGRQTTRFLKLNTALVYDEAQPGAKHVEERKTYLRDSFQDYLRQLSERDLQGSAGLAILKAELLRRARTISGSEAPQEILISDLIVQ
ncbi:flagellar basal body-associated FliL family protein [Pseudooceanicola sp. C21-150M6]|uniref:flagellar basal body-associated FliL family protein n=1 Tax=Pseudooceanicola sp. C21-150M6 TaxID=3434355 RepID=UPI003D7F1EF7